MEPNKLENEFRNKLNEREINPNANTWDRIDAMLTLSEKPKAKFPWLFVAASFVGFLLIGTVFFNGSETVKINKDTPVVLEQKKEVNNLNEPEIINEAVLPGQIQKTTIKEHEVVTDNNNLEKKPKQLNTKEEEVSIINPSKENNAIVSSAENKNLPTISDNRYVSAEKLMAEVSNTKFEPKVTDKSIEKTRKAISINPNSLLANAEAELNQSFRESALDKFNKNFNAIKTVLVNRNYE